MREASVKQTTPSRRGRTDRGLRRLRRSQWGRRPSLRPGDAINPVRWGQMRRSKEAKSNCRNQRETTDAVRPFDGCSKGYSDSLGVALSSGGSAGAERSEGSRSEPESSGAAAEAGAVSTSAARPDPEVAAKAKRRRFTAEYKQRILQEADRAAATPGGVGTLLRRQGLYSSHLVTWRRERSQGIQEALAPRKRGRKSQRSPLEEENQKLRRQNARLTEDLRTRQWLLDLIGGRDTLERLQSQLPDATDLRFLFSQLRHGRSRHRKKAATILARKRGISNSMIAATLRSSRST